MFSFILSWLVSVSLLSGLTLQCSDRQYAWPLDEPGLCCEKCKPGHYMVYRKEDSCQIKCEPCQGKRFIDVYNVELTCTACENCDKPNMEVKENCSSTQNTVCTCRPGYRCIDESCSMCVLIPTTTKPTKALPTTASNPGALPTPSAPWTPIGDTVWFLVITALLCAGIALAVVTKMKPFLRWLRSRYGYFLADKPAAQSSEDEVSKPVQEVCGKCEQLIDVCVKD